MRDLFGLEISEGALANLLQDSAPAFAAQAGLIKQRLLSSTVLASDETSVRVGKKTFWIWVFHHADSACFLIRPSRGKAVVHEFLGDVRPAVWISDRLGAQRGWASRDHQVCLAHLLRDVQYAIEAGDAAFAPGMKHLLQRAVRIGHRRPALADATLAAYHGRLQRALDELLKIVPDSKAGLKLQRIIKRFRQNLFVFLTDRAVSPTNNGSEQALAPNRRCGPASSSARSPTASDPDGAPTSTPMSALSSKPPDDVASVSSMPSVSPSMDSPCRALRSDNQIRGVSNYPWPKLCSRW